MAIVFLLLAGLGALVQLSLCRMGPSLSLRLLPAVVTGVCLMLLLSVYGGVIPLSLPAYQSLVRGGVFRIWGLLAEGFLLGVSFGWAIWLTRRYWKKK